MSTDTRVAITEQQAGALRKAIDGVIFTGRLDDGVESNNRVAAGDTDWLEDLGLDLVAAARALPVIAEGEYPVNTGAIGVLHGAKAYWETCLKDDHEPADVAYDREALSAVETVLTRVRQAREPAQLGDYHRLLSDQAVADATAEVLQSVFRHALDHLHPDDISEELEEAVEHREGPLRTRRVAVRRRIKELRAAARVGDGAAR